MHDESRENRNCPICGHNEFSNISEKFIQCKHCKVLIDFNNHELHVSECPLCGEKDLTPLPSGNILCEDCKNSFVAGKKED